MVTFYSFFSTRQPANTLSAYVWVRPCYVRGGKKIVEELQKKLGIEIGEATEDGKFLFGSGSLRGCVRSGAVILVDDDVYKQVAYTDWIGF